MSICGLQISRLVNCTADLEERKLPVRELNSDLYLVKVPIEIKKTPQADGFSSPFTGSITLDRITATLCFTARLSVATSILLLSIGLELLIPPLLAGRVAECVLKCLVFVTVLATVYYMSVRGRLINFWSLLMINLNRLRAR